MYLSIVLSESVIRTSKLSLTKCSMEKPSVRNNLTLFRGERETEDYIFGCLCVYYLDFAVLPSLLVRVCSAQFQRGLVTNWSAVQADRGRAANGCCWSCAPWSDTYLVHFRAQETFLRTTRTSTKTEGDESFCSFWLLVGRSPCLLEDFEFTTVSISSGSLPNLKGRRQKWGGVLQEASALN